MPPTHIGPQLVGGLVFGAGFVLGGLCPGTSCVAAASGRADGLALIAGLLAGVFLFGELQPALEPFYGSGDRGALVLTDIVPLSYSVTIFLLVVFALAAFRLAEHVERRVRSRA